MTKPKQPKKTQPKKTQPKKALEPFSFTSTLPTGDEDGEVDDGPEPLQTLNVREGVFRIFKEVCVTSKRTMMSTLEDVLTTFCNGMGRAVPPSRRKRRK